jgi:hypothetical protein
MTANYQPLLDTRPFFIETRSGSGVAALAYLGMKLHLGS